MKTKKKSTKNHFSKLFIAFGLCITLAIVYLLVIYLANKPDIYSHPTLSDYQIYHDKQLHFELAVPKDWKLEKEPPSSMSFGSLTVIVNDEGNFVDVITIYPMLHEEFNGTITEYIKENIDDYEIYDEQIRTKLNGSDAILLKNIRLDDKKFINKQSHQKDSYRFGNENYIPRYEYDKYIMKDRKTNYVYEVQVLRYANDSYNEEIKQALSTFKAL
jgi:hypothetical protein